MTLLRSEAPRWTHLATWGHASFHITPVGLLAPPPQAWPHGQAVQTLQEILEASWTTGGVMHQLYLTYKATRMDVADVREVMPHCVVQVIQLLQTLSCMHIFTYSFSFLGCETKVPQSRGGSPIQRGFPTKILNHQLI